MTSQFNGIQLASNNVPNRPLVLADITFNGAMLLVTI
jgi:hypothetical protein